MARCKYILSFILRCTVYGQKWSIFGVGRRFELTFFKQIMAFVDVILKVTHHFLNSHLWIRFLIGCSDKLAEVDIKFRVMLIT